MTARVRAGLAALVIGAALSLGEAADDQQLADREAPDADLAVENEKGMSYQPLLAKRIYWFVSRRTCEDINPSHPPKVRPRMRLVLGASENTITTTRDHSTVLMEKWDPGRFAYAVAVATLAQVRTADETMRIASAGVKRMCGAPTTAKEIAEEHGWCEQLVRPALK